MLSMTLGAALTPDLEAEATSLTNTVMNLPLIGAAVSRQTVQSGVEQALSTVMDAAGAGAKGQLLPILVPAFIGLGALSLLGVVMGAAALARTRRERVPSAVKRFRTAAAAV